MKKETRTVYIANDGKEFSSEEECVKWENRKFYSDPIHLKDEQIVKLLKIIHFYLNGHEVETTIRIEIKKDKITGTGFHYRAIAQAASDKCLSNIYEGAVYGFNDIMIEPVKGDVPNNNKSGFVYSVRDIYTYLDSIGFWKEHDEKPIENPRLQGYEWSEIHHETITKNPMI